MNLKPFDVKYNWQIFTLTADVFGWIDRGKQKERGRESGKKYEIEFWTVSVANRKKEQEREREKTL